jgi:hypothetical protein
MAGLTGRHLAALAGWQESKVSKIEHAAQAPSAADLRVWCLHCGAGDQLPDLLASLDSVESMYVEQRVAGRAGLRPVQEAAVALYERTRLFRIYEPAVVPGLFQTRDYATARMRRIAEFVGVPDDVEAAVDVRMARQRVIFTGARMVVVLEEAALYLRIGSESMLAAQLAHLIGLAMLPNVSLGIIPLLGERMMWSSGGFWIYDTAEVQLETPTALLTITQPSEIAVYLRTFGELQRTAVHGAAARALIVAAIDKLDGTT